MNSGRTLSYPLPLKPPPLPELNPDLSHENGLRCLLDEIFELPLVRVGRQVVNRPVARWIEQA